MAAHSKVRIVKNPMARRKKRRRDNSPEAQKRRRLSRRKYQLNKSKIRLKREKAERKLTYKEKMQRKERSYVNRLRAQGYADSDIRKRLRNYRQKLRTGKSKKNDPAKRSSRPRPGAGGSAKNGVTQNKRR